MLNYLIRNDFTGYIWKASAAEARLYAIGGILDLEYSVFKVQGGAICLHILEIL